MFNTLKKKIALGLLLLLGQMLLMGGLGIYNLYKLRIDSKAILKDNYKTLKYCQQIHNQLDSLSYSSAHQKIESILNLQENNITEPGEKEAFFKLKNSWGILKKSDEFKSHIPLVRQDLNTIQALNMLAIEKKNDLAESTADRALIFISIISVVIVMIALLLLFKFPGYITKPLNQLSDGIKEITGKNYSHKIVIKNDIEMIELADAFNNMAEKLNEYEKSNISRLLFEKLRAEAVINSLKDATIGVDSDFRILFVNAQATELLGIKAEDVVGKFRNEIAEANKIFDFIVNTEHNVPFKLLFNGKDSYFIKEKNDVLKENEIIGTLYSIKDITTFFERDIAKTNFLSTISHELKTPLSSSDIALTLLSNEKIGKLNPEQNEILSNLKNDNNRLIKLVSELLDLSQIETGKIKLNITPVKFSEVLFNVMESLKTSVHAKNLRINTAKVTSEVFLMIDKVKAEWVLVNLLSNAIKFSSEGGEIVLESKLESANKFKVSVIDTGKGIPEEYSELVFKRFYKIPASDEVKGSGLGLFIAQEFMNAMKGEIKIDKTYTNGAKFDLYFVMENKS